MHDRIILGVVFLAGFVVGSLVLLVHAQEKTKPLREEREKLIATRRANARTFILGRFRPEIQQASLTPPEKRTPYQEQIAERKKIKIKRTGIFRAATSKQ